MFLSLKLSPLSLSFALSTSHSLSLSLAHTLSHNRVTHSLNTTLAQHSLVCCCIGNLQNSHTSLCGRPTFGRISCPPSLAAALSLRFRWPAAAPPRPPPPPPPAALEDRAAAPARPLPASRLPAALATSATLPPCVLARPSWGPAAAPSSSPAAELRPPPVTPDPTTSSDPSP